LVGWTNDATGKERDDRVSPPSADQEAAMTLTMEVPPTTVAVDDLEGREAPRVQTSWAQAAIRAHGLLSQTLPDELVDEIVCEAEAGLTPTAFVLPTVLFG
jgi:hypothetical protein